MTKLEQAAKAYAEAHAWEGRCGQSFERAYRDANEVREEPGKLADAERRIGEQRKLCVDAAKRTMAATARLMRVARGEE